ncbi:MAG: DUF3552 domain-containing protein, partial [Verrucomicrobia bacterium]|nr:DUF3552 domain-containing protein [Verrucomicrobiota bacterium]
MTLLAEIGWEHGAGLAVGVALGYGFFRWKESHRRAALELQEEALLDKARSEADAVVRKARLDAEEETMKLRRQTEASFCGRQQKISCEEQRLAQRESEATQQAATLAVRSQGLQQQEKTLQQRESGLETARIEAEQLAIQRREQLQKISHLSAAEARAQFIKEVELDAMKDANDLTRHIVEDARA